MKLVFKAVDGEVFDTMAECKAHESKNVENALVGLTIEQIRAAIVREPDALHLSDAIEKVGSSIARVRKRAPRAATGAPAIEQVAIGSPVNRTAQSIANDLVERCQTAVTALDDFAAVLNSEQRKKGLLP